MKEMIMFYAQVGYLLNLSAAAAGRPWGREKKATQAGEDRQHSRAATYASAVAAAAVSHGRSGCSSRPDALRRASPPLISPSFCRWDSWAAHTEIQEDNLKP